MRYMFYATGSFNQPIENWDTHSLQNMISMFEGAMAFNQPVNYYHLNKMLKKEASMEKDNKQQIGAGG